MSQVSEIFDRALLSERRARAVRRLADGAALPDFLLEYAAGDVVDRLAMIKRRFGRAVSIGSYHGVVARHLRAAGVAEVVTTDSVAELAALDRDAGFAVVADEVRQLAGKVQLSTRDIATVIQGILQLSQSLTTSSSHCESIADTTKTEALSMQQQVDDIEARLQQLKQLMVQTATAAEEQTSVSATLARGISSLSAAAEENSTAISEVASSTRGLLGLATELGTAVGQFKV